VTGCVVLAGVYVQNFFSTGDCNKERHTWKRKIARERTGGTKKVSKYGRKKD
jgi:hypothetical protein